MDTNWKSFDRMGQLEEINEKSKHKPVLIFKHSTTCGISHSILNKMEQALPELATKYEMYYLDLLQHRDISNAIAKEYNVIHQSPQVLIIENGVCVSHASHYAINPDKLIKAVS